MYLSVGQRLLPRENALHVWQAKRLLDAHPALFLGRP
jgi:hypothetical protein